MLNQPSLQAVDCALRESRNASNNVQTRKGLWEAVQLPPWLEKEAMDLSYKKDKLKIKTAAAVAKSLQSCPTLCNPIDGSPAGSPIPGILQARILEWNT